MNIKKYINSVLYYVMAIILVINCQSMYITIPGLSSKLITLCTYGIFFVAIMIILIKGKYKKSDIVRIICIVAGLITYYGIYIYLLPISFGRLSGLILVALSFLSIYILNGRKELIQILEKYVNVIIIIAVISLFFWIFASILKIIPSTGLITSMWTGNDSVKFVKSYGYLYFEPQYAQFLFFKGVRNSAIFAEGPMASYNFSLALLSVIYMINDDKNKKDIKIFILVIAIISTLSATGIIMLGILCLKYLNTKKYDDIYKVIFRILVNIVFCIVIIHMAYVTLSQKMQVNSGQLRSSDILSAYNVWIDNIFFGTGIGDHTAIYNYLPYFRIKYKFFGLSTGLMVLLAEGGIYGSMPYIYVFFRNIVESIRKMNINLFVVTALVYYLWFMTYTPFRYINLLVLIILGTIKVSTSKE